MAAAAPVTASAASFTPCGSACDGKDPTSFNMCVIEGLGSQCTHNPDLAIYCTDDVPPGKFVESKAVDVGATIRLEYSPHCRTAWAFVNVTGGAGTEDPIPAVYVQSSTSGGTLRTTKRIVSDSDWYSYMVNDKGLLARACYSWTGSYTSTDRVCTAMY